MDAPDSSDTYYYGYYGSGDYPYDDEYSYWHTDHRLDLYYKYSPEYLPYASAAVGYDM